MKILMLDIETAPNLGYIWSLWNQNVSLSQLVLPEEVLCFAAEWLDKPYDKEFHSLWGPLGKEGMARAAHRLLTEADAVISYNGKRFDIPRLNSLMFEYRITAPEGFKHIDLLTTMKQKFGLPSKKLAYVTKWAGLPTKQDTGGFELWLGVIAGDPKSQRKMERYCRNDVTIMRPLYLRLRSWISGHPNRNLYDFGDGSSCHVCSGKLQKRGFRSTGISTYQKYCCTKCGSWSTDGKALDRSEI